MSNLKLQESVQRILLSLRGLDQLRNLFSELNYDPANESLSQRSWQEASQLLAHDPVLIATGSRDFHIIYTRLNNQLLVESERKIVKELLSNHPYTLFVFSDTQQENWHFVNVKYDSNRDKQQVFRRIRISPGEQLRTAIERLCLLCLEEIDTYSPLEIQQRHDEAFDVEKVTQQFFEEYNKVFKTVENSINIHNDEQKRLFTQKLFNRLMFIVFIQKKGWLEFKGTTKYLEALWRDYQSDNTISDKNFYRDRLTHLFFSGLNNAQSVDIIGINNGGFLQQIIGRVPYLNGGLFEQDEDDRNSEIIVPNEAIDSILHNLFDRFNFTVTESTPLDIEVAVDPEMLGKVFEELVTGRSESGSYYTPKLIVSFMCKEVLKGYLGGYEELVDEYNADNITVNIARTLLDKLATVKVVDPACGSGAYLLGMLHELHALTRLLDTRAQWESPRDDYHRKLNIIQNNLYGIDKDEFAVNIARLRLWLSLAVEFDGNPPQPLPNLDFKIESGDSLTAPSPENIEGQTVPIRSAIVDKYQIAKNSYLTVSDGNEKQRLKAEINGLETEIKNWTHPGSNNILGFDWAVKFAEVFIQGGFNIVLANPPYGANVENGVRNLYFNPRTEGSQSKDTYGLFMARGLQLLRYGGQLCYIVSDTWRTIKTHKPLRQRFLENTTIAHIIDLPTWIFKATVNTGILTVTKSRPLSEHKLIAGDLRSIKRDDWDRLKENLIAIATHSVDLQTIDYARYTYLQSLICTYDNLSYFISSPDLYKLVINGNSNQQLSNVALVKQGLSTGDNEYYIRKLESARGKYQLIDTNELLDGENISSLNEDEKLNGVDPDNYNGHYFIPFDKGGESDTDEGWLPNYYVPTEYFIDWSRDAVHRLRTDTIADVKARKGEISKIRPQDNSIIAAYIRNSQYYFREGITFSPTGIYSPTFRLGSGCIFGNKGSTIFPTGIEVKVLLGFLTSTLSRYLLKNYICHTVETGEEVLKRLIIPTISDELKARIRGLVDNIINRQKQNLRYPYHFHEQKEIDTIIQQLYNLSYEGVREIELWYCRRYPKLAEAQGILKEVQQKYETHIKHCERVLARPPAYWKSHPVLTLIAQGEGSRLEFKQTLRVDIQTNTKDRSLVFGALKTITAYLNTDGGTLLIGVSNDLMISGLNLDYTIGKAKNSDGFHLQLRQAIKDRIKPFPLPSDPIDITFVTLPEGEICKVDVTPLNQQQIAELDSKVFIRHGNSTEILKDQVLVNWKQRRNPNP